MVLKADFSQLLHARFANVPGITITEAEAVTNELMVIFGFESDIPSVDATKYLAFASAELAMKIALNTAHYFQFTDGEESVNKSMVSESYRKIASDYRSQYDELIGEENRKPKATFKNAHRIDRPPFQR